MGHFLAACTVEEHINKVKCSRVMSAGKWEGVYFSKGAG
jgi:hypothetical protein